MSIIPKLREAGRLVDVLDVPVTIHAYECYPTKPPAMIAEYETIKMWNKFVLGKEEKLNPCQSKNLFLNKY